MTQTQFKKRITTGTTGTPVNTVVTSASCAITQIVISVVTAGTAWQLGIKDEADIGGVPGADYRLIPLFTLAVSTDGKPMIINFDDPVYMEKGVTIVTTGTTAGEVAVWISMWVQE